MPKPNFSQQEIDDFMSTLTKWGARLSKKEQELLAFVTNQAQASGDLSDAGVAGVTRQKKKEEPDFWAQWSQRQY